MAVQSTVACDGGMEGHLTVPSDTAHHTLLRHVPLHYLVIRLLCLVLCCVILLDVIRHSLHSADKNSFVFVYERHMKDICTLNHGLYAPPLSTSPTLAPKAQFVFGKRLKRNPDLDLQHLGMAAHLHLLGGIT